MLPDPGLSTPAVSSTPPLSIDIRRFPWIRSLASDYAFQFDRLAAFYAGNPAEPEAWRDAIARTQAHPRPRAAVADLLQGQQRARSAPAEAIAASTQLRDPRTVAVVTGQQAVLFGGPLFTLLKALTAVRLAERVRTEFGVPAVAIFWIDAEDHDWSEVKSCGVLDTELNLQQVALGEPPGAGTESVARVPLDASAGEALAALESALPRTEYTADLLDSLRRAYQPGVGMADAFGRWLESLLGSLGLIVFNSADPAAKPLAADLFAHEIAHVGETARLATEAGTRLEALGYHAQATPAEGTVSLFHLRGGRDAIKVAGPNRFSIGDEELSTEALLARVAAAPGDFSPNVLLRPLVQDTLFPTVCYVSGPSELAYLGQLKQVYAAFGLPMPLILQRGTATIVDGNAMRFLTRHQIALETLRAQDEAALNELLNAQLPPSVDRSLEQTSRAIDEGIQALTAAATAVDATLEGAARSTLTRMQDDLKKLHGKIIQAAKKKDDTLRRQFHHARALAFPGGHPQERQIAFVYFLNKFGPALIDRAADTLPGEPGVHYVLTV